MSCIYGIVVNQQKFRCSENFRLQSGDVSLTIKLLTNKTLCLAIRGEKFVLLREDTFSPEWSS